MRNLTLVSSLSKLLFPNTPHQPPKLFSPGKGKSRILLCASFAILGSLSVSFAQLDPVVTVGTNIGANETGPAYWEGIPTIDKVVLRTRPTDVSGTPDFSRYPVAAGGISGNLTLFSQNAFTEFLKQEYSTLSKKLPLRSWMGWFVWANGTPPAGINPGIFVTNPNDYGSMTAGTFWNYFKYQWPKTAAPDGGRSGGSWHPIRLDQYPLYLTPLTLNYNWAPAMFGYQSKPLKNFPLNTFYMQEKSIVRGVNISGAVPFFYQYGDKLSAPIPEAWQQSWMYLATRPLENLVIVPGNLTPNELTPPSNAEPWSGGDPFPYPVWSKTKTAADQTPFAILVDRMGDFDADLVWEATNIRSASYEQDRYRRSAFKDPGLGNYMKMTVAQGSPFVWCEMNNAKYANFYDLIRTNIKDQIANNKGTNAGVVIGGPWAVGNTGVSYVLMYGDQVNPNQWVQESEPWYADTGGGQENSQLPGGFNPPPGDYVDKSNKTVPVPGQHNHTYYAIYYRTDQAKPVQIGQMGGKNNGTDAQGNPYFFLEFLKTGKNWFVVGLIPEMRYYHTQVTQDTSDVRLKAARAWAENMAPYAFNFLTGTKIDYAVTNMKWVTSTYTATMKNPYEALLSSPRNSGSMTVDNQTVLALNPHQYQPLTLGPDLTKKAKPQVVWSPLQKGYGKDFPKTSPPVNANKSDPGTPSRWDYWTIRGNLKTIITAPAGFKTVYPFQNFLPVMPPPNYKKEIDQTGIPAAIVTDVGTGNHKITDDPVVTITDSSGKGSGATAVALMDDKTGQVMQVDVKSQGQGYPDGLPPASVTVTISAPTHGTQATAYAQCSGGKVLAIFMKDKGSGYRSVIIARQKDRDQIIDAPVILPSFSTSGNFPLVSGPAVVLENGAGFDFKKTGDAAPQLDLIGSGTGAKVIPVQPGNLLRITTGYGLNVSQGLYPSKDANPPQLTVHVTPPPREGAPAASGPAQTANATMIRNRTKIGAQESDVIISVLINQGNYTAAPSGNFTDDAGNPIQMKVPNFSNGKVLSIEQTDPNAIIKINTPKEVHFTTEGQHTAAVAKVYPAWIVAPAIELTSPLVNGYESDVQVSFSGGDFSDTADITVPEFSLKIPSGGKIEAKDITIVNGGSGMTYNPIDIMVAGGMGFDAVLQPIANDAGEILLVRVLRGGSKYPEKIELFASNGPTSGENVAELEAVVDPKTGAITSVKVNKKGKGYDPKAVTIRIVKPKPWSDPNSPDPIFRDNAKGQPAKFTAVLGASGNVTSLNQQTFGKDYPPATYIAGTEGKATTASPPAIIVFTSNTPFGHADHARNYLGQVAPQKTNVLQVLYSSIISQYTTLAGKSVSPFGGAFLGNAAPDGYGLGGQFGGASKFIGDVFNMQQASPTVPNIVPSMYAKDDAGIPSDSYQYPILKQNNPYNSMTGALKSSVQAMQRSLSDLFLDPPSHNDPTGDAVQTTWKMDYFTLYDQSVGRVVINPTATQPAWGVVSSIMEPPAMTPAENDPKTGLSKWEKGMLWSGFGVSDQWNDQHYFYGYYLGSAALAGIFDRAWDTLPLNGPAPGRFWAQPGQMGTAIEQLFLTLAYDPDKLSSVVYKVNDPNFKYQKFAYFDQWSGHPWATGVIPGSTVASLDFTNDKFGYWRSFGTMSDQYNGENENSIFEGLQAWSAAILWGGATDRKAIVDTAIYLYSTNLAAADAYFLDKNYNLAMSKNNQFSWVPVTTVNSSIVKKNGNNDGWPANTGYVEANPKAFYEAPTFFGDSSGRAASAGQSLLKKAENTLNNFFYAYPTGSKFIMAYPPTPWTMGMVRNSNYMRKWAGAMMRDEWRKARDSALYQAADWNAMALTAAFSGVPYNPGDVPYDMDSTTPKQPVVETYVNRLWSSWVTADARPGARAALNPPFLATSVLSFLLAIDEYGTPDWTYLATATTNKGQDDNNSVVFTASFSKIVRNETTKQDEVVATFVAFNPGWTQRYAKFQRLNPDGSVQKGWDTGVITVPPKKLVMKQFTFPIK